MVVMAWKSEIRILQSDILQRSDLFLLNSPFDVTKEMFHQDNDTKLFCS